MTDETKAHVESQIVTATNIVPPKPATRSATMWVQGGGAIFFVFTLLSFGAKKFFGFELPFSFEDFSAAVAALIGAGTTLYAIWKRLKKPVLQPIEGTDAADGA